MSTSLRRARHTLVPLAAACLFVPSAALHAQGTPTPTPTTTAEATPRFVITATRTPQRVDEALAEVTVIDRRAIEAGTGRTLAELLVRLGAGVQFWNSGGPGKPTSVSLRGLEARHTLLLIDGVRYGSATVGAPAWENIPLDAIERIEIVRGPLSGLYGSDAVGGVVQVFTRQGAPGLAFDAAVSAGTAGTRQAGGGLRWGDGPFSAALQLQGLESGDGSATNPNVPFGNHNPDDDRFRQHSVSAQAGWQIAPGWALQAQTLQSRGRTQLDDGPGADARAALRSGVSAVALSGRPAEGWRSTLRAGHSRDAYETLATASAFTPLGTIATTQRQLSWENTVATPLGSALLLAETVRQQVQRPGAPFAVSDRRITGIGAGLNGSAGAHGWQANLRHDRNSQFGNQTTGSLGYGLDVLPGWRVAAALGTSFVAPSFNQLYFPNFGNPNLLPEEGRHAEISLQWAEGPHQWRLARVDNRIRGYITAGNAPVNLPRTRIDGWALSGQSAWSGFDLTASLDLLDPRNDTVGNPNFGRRLPLRARQSLRLGADTVLPALAGVRVGATLLAVGERFDNAANTTRLGGYGTLDVRAAWALAAAGLPGFELGLGVNNLADKRYETVFGYNQPGREAVLTLRWRGR